MLLADFLLNLLLKVTLLLVLSVTHKDDVASPAAADHEGSAMDERLSMSTSG